MDVWRLIGQWAAGAAGGGAIALFVARWAAERWGQRLLLKWQHECDAKLEGPRAQVSARDVVLHAALSSGSAAHLAAQERRVEAVEALWDGVLCLRQRLGPALFLYQIVTPEEYDVALSKTHIRADLSSFTAEGVSGLVAEVGRPLEKLRPFLGQRLWVLFWTYRAFNRENSLEGGGGSRFRADPRLGQRHRGAARLPA